MDNLYELPLGLMFAMAQNMGALEYFESLSPNEKMEVINHAKTLRSKAEMAAFVSTLKGANH